MPPYRAGQAGLLLCSLRAVYQRNCEDLVAVKRILIVLILVAIAVAAWYLVPRKGEEPVPPPAIGVPEAGEPFRPEPAAEPGEDAAGEIDDLLPAEPTRPPLPPLQDSDPAVLESADELTFGSAHADLLVKESILPRLVATVDALTARQVPGKLLPLEPPGTPFQANVDVDPPTPMTNDQGDPLEQYTLDPVNYDRYEPYVALLESIDGERFAAEYLHYAPLLQQAYTELGYPEGDFTARVLEVMDHLLATPEISGPVRMIKPEAYYEFVDPELEAMSAGQKALIRMGGENAARVKAKLREFRAALGG
jgi:hypothetical protein